jgi:hypothetical protein
LSGKLSYLNNFYFSLQVIGGPHAVHGSNNAQACPKCSFKWLIKPNTFNMESSPESSFLITLLGFHSLVPDNIFFERSFRFFRMEENSQKSMGTPCIRLYEHYFCFQAKSLKKLFRSTIFKFPTFCIQLIYCFLELFCLLYELHNILSFATKHVTYIYSIICLQKILSMFIIVLLVKK